jgi:hypothetical protein
MSKNKKMKRKKFDHELKQYQVELVKLQEWVRAGGEPIRPKQKWRQAQPQHLTETALAATTRSFDLYVVAGKVGPATIRDSSRIMVVSCTSGYQKERK